MKWKGAHTTTTKKEEKRITVVGKMSHIISLTSSYFFHELSSVLVFIYEFPAPFLSFSLYIHYIAHSGLYDPKCTILCSMTKSKKSISNVIYTHLLYRSIWARFLYYYISRVLSVLFAIEFSRMSGK